MSPSEIRRRLWSIAAAKGDHEQMDTMRVTYDPEARGT